MSKIIGITAATPTKGGTGSGLPEVTAKDNGKVLKVKNGAWGVGVDADTEQIQTDYEQNNASKPDYIKNRPFYELPAPMDVSWDGDWESAFGTAVEDQGGWWHKVSGQTPEPSAFIGGTVTYAKGLATKSATIPENGVLDAREIGGYAAISGYDGAWVGGIMVVYDDTKFDGYDGAGIYFRYDDAQDHTLGVTFEGAKPVVKKIDKKFLPDDIGTNIMTFDSVEEMNAANVPEGTIALVPSSGESGGADMEQVKEYIDNQNFWRENDDHFPFQDYINLTTAMQTPGGSIRVDAETGSELENLLKEVIAAFTKGPVKIMLRPLDNSLLGVRVFSWITQLHFALVTTVVEYGGMLLMVSFEFHLDRLIYTVRSISAEPMVPAT